MPSAAKVEWPQGTPLFEVMWRSVTESLAGNGVTESTEMEVTATANNREVSVAPGTIFYVGSNYTLGSSTTTTVSVGDANDPRWDIVYFDTATSSVGTREGTPSATPEPPDLQGGEMLLAVLKVTANFDAPFTRGTDLFNWRAQFSNEAEETHYDDSTGVYGVNNVDAALDELQEAAQISAYPLAIATDTEANAYPLANSDLSNSTITVSAGNGLSTTNASIGLGGSATLDIVVDGIGTSELDLSITPTWTGGHTFDAAQTFQEVATPATPSAGYAQLYPKSDGFLYSQDDAGLERRVGGDVKTNSVSANYTTSGEDILFIDPSGTGGLTITLASADAYDGHGITLIDVGASSEANPITVATEGTETIDGLSSKQIASDSAQLLLESDGTNWFTSGGAAAVGINDEEFNTDESGAVAAGNAGVAYITQLEDTRTFAVYQAGLILADGQAAPTDLDLVIATLDNAGAATLQTVVVDGDGTLKSDQKGDPLASYQNTSGAEQTVAILVDNGNFNAGTGSSQDIFATAHGQVEV